MAFKELVVNLQSIRISLPDAIANRAIEEGDFESINESVLFAIQSAFARGEAPIESVEEDIE